MTVIMNFNEEELAHKHGAIERNPWEIITVNRSNVLAAIREAYELGVKMVDIMAWLESQEFYELCQAYRTAPAYDQEQTTRAFDELKRLIKLRIIQSQL
jgi:hypothetical protein